MGLFVRTIGIACAEAKITLANIAYNIDRLIFHERRAATGYLRLATTFSNRIARKSHFKAALTAPEVLLTPCQCQAAR